VALVDVAVGVAAAYIVAGAGVVSAVLSKQEVVAVAVPAASRISSYARLPQAS
jgi:hypothetical protein